MPPLSGYAASRCTAPPLSLRGRGTTPSLLGHASFVPNALENNDVHTIRLLV